MKTIKLNYALLFTALLFIGVSCSTDEDEMMPETNSQDLHVKYENANNGAKAKMYTVDFGELNGSGVTGTAELILEGNDLTVTIMASGLEANSLHPQHIHGFMENKGNSTCPPPSADEDGDGLVSVAEGAPFYGGIQQALILNLEDDLSFPVADEDGKIEFEMTYTVNKDITPLQNRAIVLHGMTVDGTYQVTLPVVCGQITSSQGK